MKKIIKTLAFAAALIFISAAVLTACTGQGESAETETQPVDESASVKIYCFNAGNADAFLFTTENGTVLIDAGIKGFGKEILAHLEEIGRDSIDYLIVTHFDKDHVGGAAKVINNVTVSNVLQTNYIKESTEYEKYKSALKKSGITPVTVSETVEFELDGVKFSVDPPAIEEYSDDPSNNSSLITTVVCGSRRFLFTGDAENDRMAEYISKGLAVDCDVLKVPHHGKWDRLLKNFVAQTKPEYAVITSSDAEPEDEKAVSLLTSSGAEVFLTRTAPVVITCEGGELTVAYDN